jgi:regulatory protein
MDESTFQAGTITRVATQRKNTDRVSIYVSGEFALGVHRDVLLEHPVRAGLEVDAQKLQRMAEADERIRAKVRAMDLLAYRARSRHELSQRLLRDGFSETSVGGALSRMTELGYLNDESFARDYAAARLRSKGYGRYRLVNELRKRGVNPALANAAADEAIGDGEVELENARAFVVKRMRRLESMTEALAKRKKLYDALTRQGFGSDVIRRVVDEALAEE